MAVVFTIKETSYSLPGQFHDLMCLFYNYTCDIKFLGCAYLLWFWHKVKRSCLSICFAQNLIKPVKLFSNKNAFYEIQFHPEASLLISFQTLDSIILCMLLMLFKSRLVLITNSLSFLSLSTKRDIQILKLFVVIESP